MIGVLRARKQLLLRNARPSERLERKKSAPKLSKSEINDSRRQLLGVKRFWRNERKRKRMQLSCGCRKVKKLS